MGVTVRRGGSTAGRGSRVGGAIGQGGQYGGRGSRQ